MKKETRKENKGVTGKGTDYSVYRLERKEAVISFLAGSVFGYLAFSIFFGVLPFGIVLAAAGGVVGIRSGRDFFRKKRDRSLMIQFRDFLDSLSSSFSAGQNVSSALFSAHEDMLLQYGEGSVMAQETKLFLCGMKNNITAEALFDDFARRSGKRDIKTFSDTFCICSRSGGNIREIVMRTTRTLNEKMQMEAETEAIASKGKNELLLMTFMPFVIVPMLKTLGESSISGNNIVTIAVKSISAAVIAAAFIIGRKITDIKF